MSRPSQFYFGADGAKGSLDGPPKIFLRAMLYATAKRGRVLESLWVTVHHGERSQTFNIWVYGDEALKRGAGLFVGDTGLVTSHHFLLPHGETFEFLPGDYDVRVFGRSVGDRYPRLLVKQTLALSEKDASKIRSGNAGVYFDYGPISSTYVAKPHAPVHDWIDSMRTGPPPVEENDSLPKTS